MQSPPRPLRYFLYTRKSTDSEDRQVLSLPAQDKEVREYLARNGITEVIPLPPESKTAKRTGRPVFNELLRRIEKGEADGMAAWHPDRLARNMLDGGRVIDMLDRGVLKDLQFPTYRFENTPQGRLMLTIFFGNAKYFVDNLSEQVKRGFRTKLGFGWYPGYAPMGYLNRLADNGGMKIIVPDPERFPIVRRLWDYLLTGSYPVAQIYRLAREEWDLRPRPRRNSSRGTLTLSGVHKMFARAFYMGVISHGGESGPGKHTPMVTPEEFARAQEILVGRSHPRPQKEPFALTGVFRCGSCGCMVTAEQKTKQQKNGNVHHYVYLRCTRKGGPCAEPFLTEKGCDEQVIEFLATISPGPRFLAWAERWLCEQERTDHEADTAVRTAKEKAMESSARELANLTHLRLRDLMDDEEYAQEKERLVREQARLQAELSAAGRRQEHVANAMRDVLQFAARAKDRFVRGTLSEKKEILATIGSDLSITGRKVLISAKKPFRLLQERAVAIRDEFTRLGPLDLRSSNTKTGCLVPVPSVTSG